MSPREVSTAHTNTTAAEDGNDSDHNEKTMMVVQNQENQNDIEEASSSVGQDESSARRHERESAVKHARTLCFNCLSWSRERIQITALGCLSSCLVLTIRLLLDQGPLAYLIHSIVVFLDMVLIHLFTHSVWLSVSGEIMTVIFFLAFHFTEETVFELLETTLIAVLCSFHLIQARSKSMDRQEELEVGMESLRRQSMMILRQSIVGGGVNEAELKEFIRSHQEGGGMIAKTMTTVVPCSPGLLLPVIQFASSVPVYVVSDSLSTF